MRADMPSPRALILQHLSFDKVRLGRLRYLDLRAVMCLTHVTWMYIPGFDCWSDGYAQGDCCDVAKFGPGGNEESRTFCKEK